MVRTDQPLFSVVLCTYNRCELMMSALRSVCDQTIDSSRYEVIVVDNNSTDQTRKHITDVSQQYPFVRYCFEENQGLSHSRNTGFHKSQGQYIGYIDDDCTVPREWLAMAQEIVERVNPAVFGGPYRPFYNSMKPRWYRDAYGSFDGGPDPRVLDREEYLSGTNLFIRRTVLERLDGFRSDLGMVGDRLGYGEETLIQRRIRGEWSHEAIYYDPRLTVSHLVRSEKMRILWCGQQMFVSGRDWERVRWENRQSRVGVIRPCLQAGRALLRFIGGIVKGMVARDRSKYPFYQNYLYEVVFVQLQAMGALYGQMIRRSI